jgi:pimeloyl-ACP methyl ester carboxylesterase
MFYYPTRQVYATPAAHGLKYEEVAFVSRDGTRLAGWFVPAAGQARGTVVHFHDKMRQIPVVAWFRRPLSYLVVSNARSPAAVIARIAPTPLLLIHGTDDQVIPYQHGELLFAAAKDPKTFVTVPGGQHTDALTRDDPIYRKLLVTFFNQQTGE